MGNYYIGLSTSGHDPAFAIVDNQGRVLFAEATERFFRDKRAWGIHPDHTSHLSTTLQEIINHDPAAKFFAATTWARSKADIPIKISSVFFDNDQISWMVQQHDILQNNASSHLKTILKDRLQDEISRFEHHLCHAAGAYFSSPEPDATCLVLDGEGDVGSASCYQFYHGQYKRLWRSWGPGSLGGLYSFGTNLCGFNWVLGEEWKVMGLAAFGNPQSEIMDHFRSLIHIEKGKIRNNEGPGFEKSINSLNEYAKRIKNGLASAADMASSLQLVYAEKVDEIISYLSLSEQEHLIFTGGCALNSSYNGTIKSNHNIQSVHVPFAPADDGNAIGAALLCYSKYETKNLPWGQVSPYLGKNLDQDYIQALLKNSNLNIKELEDGSVDEIASLLQAGKIIGIFRGHAEFGPRSLGNRSILANPMIPEMKDKINALVKGREDYRPFAPVIRREDITKWMENDIESPYMSFTSKWRQEVKHLVPAVVHKDGTGRLQSLDQSMNPWLYSLLSAFELQSGIPILLNTSFNIMGKPIVHFEADAVEVLLTTGLDAVLIGNYLIQK